MKFDILGECAGRQRAVDQQECNDASCAAQPQVVFRRTSVSGHRAVCKRMMGKELSGADYRRRAKKRAMPELLSDPR